MVSIIAKFRAGHRVAREQPSKKGDVVSSQPTAPYRHVPSHALTDALAGTPGSYRKSDRARIREQHRRRSAMTSTPASSEPATSAGPSRPSSSYTVPHMTGSSGMATVGERAPFGLRPKPKIERRDSGPGRSRLSSMGTRMASTSFLCALHRLPGCLQRCLPTSAAPIRQCQCSHPRPSIHQVGTAKPPHDKRS